MHREDGEQEAVMRRAIVAVADAARTVARTRSAIERASGLVREAVPRAPSTGSVSRTRAEASRALDELEVAGREAGRVAADITSAGFRLATAADRLSVLMPLLPPDGGGVQNAVASGNLIGRAVQAAAASALLAEDARAAVDRAAALVRRAARNVGPDDWPRRIRADAALADVSAAARGAGALADETASARLRVSAATCGGRPALRVEDGGALD